MQKKKITGKNCIILGSTNLSIECTKILLENDFEIINFVTEDENVINWCNTKKIKHIDYKTFSKSKTFCDYLFSIINNRVIKFEIIQAHVKKLAINYHDGPLPKYAGLNSTTWAILNDEKEYGITWHVITKGVNEGDILRQSKFLLDNDNTALSLNLKCTKYAIDEFKKLIMEIKLAILMHLPQDLSKRTYYGKDKIPSHLGVIDFNWDVKTCNKVARALSFGEYPNTVAALKIFLQGKFYLLDQYSFVIGKNNTSPGSIIFENSGQLVVNLKDGLIVIKSLFDLDGNQVSLSNFSNEKNNITPKFTDKNLKFLSDLHKQELETIHELRKYKQSFQLTKPLLKTKNRQIDFKNNSVNEYFIISNIVIFFIRTLFGDDTFSINFIDSRCNLDDPVRQLISFSAAKTFDKNVGNTTVYEFEKKIESIYENDIGYFKEIFYRYHINPINKIKSVGIYLLNDNQIYKIIPEYGINFFVSKEKIEISALIKLPTGYLSSIYKFLKNQLKEFEHISLIKIKEINIVTKEIFNKIVYSWNETVRDYPQDRTILESFAEQVEKSSGNTAVIYEGESLSYRELDEKSNQLARYIRRVYLSQTRAALTPDTLIGIYVERSLEMVIGILGILKAGAAYVPLDTDSPPERLHYILGDTESKVILTQSRLVEKIRPCFAQVLIVLDQENYREEDKRVLKINHPPESLAYVIYTSGTTGHPKGVMIQHGALVSQLIWMQRKYQFNPQDNILQRTPYYFDASVWELLLPLICGARLVLMAPGAHHLPAEVYTAIHNYDITRIQLVPSILDFGQIISPLR